MDQLNQHLGDFLSTTSAGSGRARTDSVPSNSLSSNLSGLLDDKSVVQTRAPVKASPISTSTVDAVASREGLSAAQRTVMGALLGQESDNGQNAVTSVDGARGAGQIMPDTFRRYAKPGEQIDNPDHNLAVMARIVRDLGTKFNDDPARIATGYFSGDGNVNAGDGNAWKADKKDGNGKSVSSYVSDVLKRVGDAAVPAANAAPAAPDLSKAPKWADIANKPEFQGLQDSEKAQAKQAYFDYWIAPNIGAKQRAAVREQFTAKKDEVPGPLARAANAVKGAVSSAFTTQGEGVGVVDPMSGIDPAGLQSATGPAQAPTDPAMRGSVMANLPAAEPAKSASMPISERFRTHFDNAYNSASPEQRQAMERVPGIIGILAKERNAQAGALLASTSTDMLDPRAEARARRLARDGMDSNLTESWAKTAAARGTVPGDEVGSIGKTDFDFDAQKKFNDDPFWSNPAVRGAVKGVEGFKQGVLGLNQFAAEAVGADTMAAGMARRVGESQNFTDAMGDPKSGWQRNFEGAISSIAQQIPALIGGVATGSEPLVLSAMFVQSFGQEYGEGRGRGQTPAEAATRAAQFAALEVIGEKFGLHESLAGIKAAAKGDVNAAIRNLTNALIKEVPGEELTTVGQFGVDKEGGGIGLNTEAGVRELVGQMADTFVQTVMQSGLMMGGGKAIGTAVQKLDTPERQVAREINRAADAFGKREVVARPAPNLKGESEVDPGTTRIPAGDLGPVAPAVPAPSAGTAQPPAASPTEAPAAAQPPAAAPTATLTAAPAVQQPVSPVADAFSDQDILNYAEMKREALLAKRDGQTEQVIGEDGKPQDVERPGVGLTADEQAELDLMEKHAGDALALGKMYGLQPGDGALSKDAVDGAAHTAATSPTNDLPEPTDAQKEAGNYKKGHVVVQGLDISIENPEGSTRRGVSPDGKAWENTLQNHYGYIKRTEGADGDHVDAFIGPNPASEKVFVVDQVDPTSGKFDEHKVMVGFDSKQEADAAYHANYEADWNGRAAITEVNVDQFKDWLKNGNTKTWFSKPKTEKEVKNRKKENATNVPESAQVQQKALAEAATQSTPAAEKVAPKTEREVKEQKLAVGLAPDVQALVARAITEKGIKPGNARAELFRDGIIDAAAGKELHHARMSYVEGYNWAKDQVSKKPGAKTEESVPQPAPAEKAPAPKTEKELKERKAAAKQPATKPEAPTSLQTGHPAKPITDFGEKIGGARKDVWTSFKEDLNAISDDDIVNQPLSKIWPAPDYQKLIDSGMDGEVVAVMRALRDEVPSKPRSAWKVKRWAEQVKTLRDFANGIMDGKTSAAELRREMGRIGSKLSPIAGRIDLYMEVGHSKSLEGIRFQEHHYSLYKGQENVTLWVVEKDAAASAFSNWPREIATGKTKEEAIANFKAKYDSLDMDKAAKQPTFDLFSERGVDGYFVGKKIGRNYAKLEGPFNTVKEARQYRDENTTALQAKLEKYKEIPRERRDMNEPRVGVDMRNGQDVAPEMFAETFKFRGVEFGNWVEQKRRQQDLNDAFDALMDMAAVLGIPPAAISLNGQLGLAFGARGNGGVNPAAAHYEPGKIVINLTKRTGAGSLGHEWWHALDNYFSRMRDKGDEMMTESLDVSLAARGSNFMSRGQVRREMIAAFGQVVKAIRQSALLARSSKLDAKRSKEYWTTGPEMSARAFESYLISKLQDQNASNDYLANIVSEETWKAAEKLGFELDDSYPYPTAGEIPAIRAAFDAFFQAVETRESEGGRVALFSRGHATEEANAKLRDIVNAAREIQHGADEAVAVNLRPDLAQYGGSPDVHLVWGDSKKGLVHIGSKRSIDVISRVLETVAVGADVKYIAPKKTVRISHEGTTAVLSLDEHGKQKTWLLTGWEEGEPDASGEVGTQSTATQGTPTFSRDALGAGLDSILRRLENKANAGSDARFARAEDTAVPEGNRLSIGPEVADSTIERIRSAFASEFNGATFRLQKVGDFSDLPKPILDDAARQGVAPTAKGVLYGDTVYVVQNNHRSAEDLEKTIFHELYGHAATHAYFGKAYERELNTLLDKIGGWEGIKAISAKHNIDLSEYLDGLEQDDRLSDSLKRAILTDELLAHIAEKGPSFKQKIKEMWGAVRDWLRRHGFVELAKYNDADLAYLLKQARRSLGSSNAVTGPIVFSRGPVQQDLVREFGKPKFKNVDGWDKSVGTQLNKALKEPQYRKVFDIAVDRENVISLASVRPAELAPAFLPRVDDFKSAAKTVILGRKKNTQMQLATDALVAGTLQGEAVLDGKVWSDDDLRKQFGMDDIGIAHYRQARAAIDASLDEVAAAEGYALLQMSIPRTVRYEVISSPGNAEDILTKAINKRIALEQLIYKKARDNEAPKAKLERMESEIKGLMDAREMMYDVFKKAKALKEAGYTPLMRFGKFKVSVEEVDPHTGKTVIDDKTGEPRTLYFGRFETEGEAEAEYYRLVQLYRDHANLSVKAGPVNDIQYRMYAGLSPETLALFAEEIGADQVMKTLYQTAVSERSALKRRLERKNIAGYSHDMPRVLANFITSNGRFAAQRYYTRDLNNAIKYIPRDKADVQKEAQKLKEFLDNPGDAGAGASSIAFVWFLGGNIASAAVNATQPIMMTAPYLSQWGAGKAATALAKAVPYAMGKKQITDPELRDALKRAAQEGKVDAQEIFHLYSVGIQGVVADLTNKAAKIPGIGNKVKAGADDLRARLSALGTLWGMPFAMVEGFNRRLTFIAAWDVAKATGQGDPFAFAVRAVDETQGIYNKVNRPNWARSAPGRVIMTFAQYKIAYVELISRMWKYGGADGKKAAAFMVAVLILASGANGLPYADDIDDLIDTVGQFFGRNTNMKRNKRQWAYETIGKFWGDLALYGISSKLPLDFSGRLGLGNMLPGTALLKPSDEAGRSKQIAELFGPLVAVGAQIGDAYDAVAAGDPGKALEALAPTAVRNAMAGLDMAVSGEAKDYKGRKVMDVGLSDAAWKGIGFNPTVIAENTRKVMPVRQDIALQRSVEADIVEMWARGAVEHKPDLVDRARDKLNSWNKTNPETPIAISSKQIVARAKQMATERDSRTLKAAPREMRGAIAQQLEN
jgi:hypothetical protein